MQYINATEWVVRCTYNCTCMHDYDLTVFGIATESTQVIGMSATLSNIDEIAQFLRAEIYSDDFRPVS